MYINLFQKYFLLWSVLLGTMLLLIGLSYEFPLSHFDQRTNIIKDRALESGLLKP